MLARPRSGCQGARRSKGDLGPHVAERGDERGPRGVTIDRVQKASPVVWLVVYSSVPAPVLLFALIFAFEGAASLRTHPENLVLTLAAGLFILSWPLSALAGWVLLAFGRVRAAWLVSGATALVLASLWTIGLGVAAVCGRH